MRTLWIIVPVLLSTNIAAQTNTAVDTDGNGLIDINDLETLNAIRHQPDGTSYKATAEAATGSTESCPNNVCIGYELMKDLDFNDDDSYSSTANKIIWTTGAGWQPIGAPSDAFIGKFEGNGFTISNLTIDRGDATRIGLFGYTGSDAEITNTGLLNVNIIGRSFVGALVGENNSGTITNSYATGSVSGNSNVGALVGENNSGTIMNSYATGSVSGNSDLGGLVGENNSGIIMNSYATGSVSGNSDLGGLAGWNFSGTITNSYATGSVSGSGDVGGLVGSNSGLFGRNPGTITNSYATGFISRGGSNVGGLVGFINRRYSTITDSYWDVNTSEITVSAGGTSKTMVELIAGSAQSAHPDRPYYRWSNANWNFGTDTQYPVLKYARGSDTNNRACRREGEPITHLPVCGSLLSPALRYGLSKLQLVEGDLSPDFNVVVPSYRGTVVSNANTIQFRPITVNPDAEVYITANEQTRGMAINSGDESGMISLNTDGITTITIEVENGGETAQTFIYTLYLNYHGLSVDVDRDNDGLIEIDNLEALNAMRYQPDGTSYSESATAPNVATGCPNDGCRGYELTRDLDFNDDDSYSSTANRIIWTTGVGWQPVGDSSNAFTGKFEGNGFTISNLRIDRSGTSRIGLFGFTRSGAEITNVGLLNINIIGNSDVGGLVGENEGTITNSYAAGSVSGSSSVGGLVGSNDADIASSYAVGSVSGNFWVGGLVGENEGTITNSYAAGSASGDGSDVGGLVGENRGGTVTNSYAAGSVSGNSNVGGLVGENRGGTITDSYWDRSTSGRTTSDDGRGRTTLALQEPTMAGGIYINWSDKVWDFGTSSQYPILKYTDNPNTDSSECRSESDTTTDLPVCGSLLSPPLRYGLSELQLVEGDLSPDFDVVVPSYRGTAVSSASTIQFRPITVNPDAEVYITANEETRGMAINSGDESGMISLNTNGITTITIEVKNRGQTTQTYTLYLNYYEFNGDVDRDDDGLIEIDNLEELNAMRYQPDGTGYRESETALKIVIGCPNNICEGYELTRDLNFNDTDSYSSIAHKITWTMGEGWQPVGDSFFNAFTGKFEGNDFMISNLTIGRNGTNEIGLFGYTGGGAEITNVGLLNVNIIGSFGVGGLVGSNAANITNSYVAGSVSGNSNVGGLVGSNAANITNSYVAGSVSGNSNVGGLVGENRNGTITNSYATGSVSGDGSDVGGLVGENRDGTITNSYATSSVSEDGSDVGGLVGDNQGGTIMESYWDEQTSERTTSDGGDGKTTLALQEPTTATGIYSGWGTEVWDFGTSSQYPILKSADSDILLSGQGVGLRDLEVLTSGARLTSIFGATTTHYVISFLATRTSDITLRLKAYNTDATIRVVRQGEDNNYFDEKSSDGRSELIPIDVNTALVITVTEADTETTIYMISFQVETNTAPTIMIAPSLPQTLPVNSTAHIVVSVADDNFNVGHSVTLMAKSSSRTIVSVTTSMETDNITTDTSITFTLTAKQSGEATITFTATDSGELSDSVELPVRVNAILMISNVPMDVNTTPTLSGVPTEPIRLLEGTETTRNITINDADVDDSLSVRIDTSDSMIATTTIIATDGATRTLEVRGVGAGRAMITVTVNDGRGATNSAASEQFEVQVEANTTPTIMITPSLGQTLPVNSTAHIVVSVMDDNFNLDDIVTLEAMSSSQTIVSVTTSAETDDITTDTSITFMLTAKRSGEAVITFTATDSGKLSDSGAVSVRVHIAIRIHVKVFLEGLLQ